MAVLYITEFDQLGIDSQGNTIMSGVYPTLVPPYSIQITGGQTLSPVFSSSTRYVGLHNDAACSFAIAVSPVAVTTADRLGPGERIFWPLRTTGGPFRLAVTSNT
jgi:hypothetical protein